MEVLFRTLRWKACERAMIYKISLVMIIVGIIFLLTIQTIVQNQIENLSSSKQIVINSCIAINCESKMKII